MHALFALLAAGCREPAPPFIRTQGDVGSGAQDDDPWQEEDRPLLSLSESRVEFGDVPVGCSSSVGLVLSNDGTGLASITAITPVADEFSVTAESSLPHTLAPSESMSFELVYTPTDTSSDSTFVTIDALDPDDLSLSFEAMGHGTGDEVVDVFQASKPPVDVIVAYDSSTTMRSWSVVDATRPLFEGLAGLDFHVAFVVDDDGCVSNYGPQWIDGSTSLDDAEHMVAVMTNAGWRTPDDAKRAFTLLETALDETVDGGCNEGLVRAGATLQLVGISDNEEGSTETWEHYVEAFRGWVGHTGDLKIHGIGGDYPEGCGTADYYEGVYEASVETGGLFQSICDFTEEGWGELARVIAEDADRLDGPYSLSRVPVLHTVEVTVDGAGQPDGWILQEDDNTLFLGEEVHVQEGYEVEVRYLARPECAS